MSGEPNAEEIIKAAQKRTRKPAVKPAVEATPTREGDSGAAVPVTQPEAAPKPADDRGGIEVKPDPADVPVKAEVVSGTPVDTNPAVKLLLDMGCPVEAARDAVDRYHRMWG